MFVLLAKVGFYCLQQLFKILILSFLKSLMGQLNWWVYHYHHCCHKWRNKRVITSYGFTKPCCPKTRGVPNVSFGRLYIPKLTALLFCDHPYRHYLIFGQINSESRNDLKHSKIHLKWWIWLTSAPQRIRGIKPISFFLCFFHLIPTMFLLDAQIAFIIGHLCLCLF